MINNFKKFLIEKSNNSCPFFNDSAKKLDFHQAILEVGYNTFNDHYDNMINSVDNEFGYKFAMLIMLGDYNYQVVNSGHMALFINNYIGKDKQLLSDTLYWMRESELDKTSLGKKIYNIISDSNNIFQDMDENEYCDNCGGFGEIQEECDDCGGDGVIVDDDDDEETCDTCNGDGIIYDTCPECDGNGYIDNIDNFEPDLDNLDNVYYIYNKKWMKFLNNYSHDLLIEYCGKDFDEKINKVIKTKKFNL